MREGIVKDVRSSFWPDRRTVWRWHFFAGLFCLPFVTLLCLTGILYLFKPQVDAAIDRPYETRPAVIVSNPAKEVEAALKAVPGARLLAYELPRTPRSAARVLVDRRGEAVRVYVDRATLAVLKMTPEEQRFERLVFRLHGQLLMGNAGSALMEMVACWTIVLVITGLWLWWPRGRWTFAGVLWPRIGANRKPKLRDLHAVTGAWVSLFLVLFLVTGLPWSYVWGNVLKAAEHSVGRLLMVPDWEIGAVPARDLIAGRHVVSPSEGQHGGQHDGMIMPGMNMSSPGAEAMKAADNLAALNNVAATARGLGFAAPVLITPPREAAGSWTVRSDTENRPKRQSAAVSCSGTVLSRSSFDQKSAVDRLVAYGVAAHVGQLFGIVNQILNLIVAAGLLVMSGAATALWLRQKPPGSLGALPAASQGRAGWGAVVLTIGLGLLLPELGAALLLLLLASKIRQRQSQTL